MVQDLAITKPLIKVPTALGEGDPIARSVAPPWARRRTSSAQRRATDTLAV
jgi:hypothetical protein